jgi:hypothetical protein
MHSLMTAAGHGEVDVVLVTDLARLRRVLEEADKVLADLRALGVSVECIEARPSPNRRDLNERYGVEIDRATEALPQFLRTNAPALLESTKWARFRHLLGLVYRLKIGHKRAEEKADAPFCLIAMRRFV